MAVQCNNRLGGAIIVLSAGCPYSVPMVLGFTALFVHQCMKINLIMNRIKTSKS